MSYNPTKITTFKDGTTSASGTVAKGSLFDNEFDQLYGNWENFFGTDGTELTIQSIVGKSGDGVDIEGVHIEDDTLGVNYGIPIEVGTAFSLSCSYPALAALSSTEIAFIDFTNKSLRHYTWTGSTWTLDGSLSISGAGVPALCALSSTEIAYFDSTNTSLRHYTWSGSAWTLDGSLSISGAGTSALAALSSTEVAYYDTGNDELRHYTWSGSAWTLDGSLAVSSLGANPALAALSSTEIALIDPANDELRHYTWDGSDWTLDGSLAVSGNGTSSLCAFNKNKIAYLDGTGNNKLYIAVWDSDTSTWVLGPYLTFSSSIGNSAICALSPAITVLIGDNIDELQIYAWNTFPSGLPYNLRMS